MRTIFITCLSAILLLPCISSASPYRDSLVYRLGLLSRTGLHDSVITVSLQEAGKAMSSGDTLSALYADIFAAQSYLFMNYADSVKHYADIVSGYQDRYTESRLWIIFNNVMGCWSLRVDMNYAEAFNYFTQGLRQAEVSKDTASMISMLLNIVNIHYYRSSTDGTSYASRAWTLAQNADISNSGYYRCVAGIGMAQMLLVSGKTDEASVYLDGALESARANKAASQYSQIYIMKAGICEKNGLDTCAARLYRKAYEHITFSDNTTSIQLALRYGLFLERTGHAREAMRLYLSALKISEQSQSIELKHLVLGKAADLAFKTGDKDMALTLYRKDRQHTDSLVDSRNNEFTRLMFINQEYKHRQDMLAKELKEQKTAASMQKAALITALIIAVAAMLLILYLRQNKLYRTLVKQHRNLMQRMDNDLMDKERKRSEEDMRLFKMIDRLMREEKLFLNKDISLEMLAEKTASNKTYCSNAINSCAGMNFYRYVDVFRIEEATKRLIQGGKSVLLKELAYDLGYGSLTVFSKAFTREIGCTPSIYRNNIGQKNSQ